MSRLVYLVSDPITADCFLRGQLGYLRSEGFDVHLVSAPGPRLDGVGEAAGVATHGVGFRREMSPGADLAALGAATRLLRRLSPAVVNASTPKAALLGMMAARRAGVRHRLYLVRGLRLETTRRLKRRLLAAAERWTVRCATGVYCVSSSLQRRYAELGFAATGDTRVLANGSSNGVSIERFAVAREPGARDRARRDLGLPGGSSVIGFVGRLTRDKGIEDLVASFLDVVRPACPEARLVLIGDFEPGDPVAPTVRARMEREPAIEVRSFVTDLAREYAAFDVVAFPSYREGFPNVPLEAAACALPVAGYRATGTVDAVVEGRTGTLVEVGDRAALGRALCAYLRDADLRRAHGTAGLARAEETFRPEIVWRAWRDEYRRLLDGGSG